MTTPYDDLGEPLDRGREVRRVVSLVPSLTESLATTCPELLVGATDWCTHPESLDVARVRGTKNPDLRAIGSLRPDLVVANMEENREIDVRRLRAEGVPVWVTRTETVDGALRSLRRLFVEALRRPAPEWLDAADEEWSAPVEPVGARAAVAVWRDPWMVVGRSTFTGDLVERLGLVHAFADDPDRYPAVDVARLREPDLDLVLLPDEPYRFTAQDGPEALGEQAWALVSGRLLTWYGPSLVGARSTLRGVVAEALSRRS